MTTSATQEDEKRTDFSGPYREQLTELSKLIDWLWTEHGKSFVKAGDDKVYAFGGGGYIIVLDETKWQGLIEFMTPKGAVTIKPDESGKLAVQATAQGEATVKQILKDGIAGLRKYYEDRYWNTPTTP